MSGELYALSAALAWALGGITLKWASNVLPPFYLSRWRNTAAWISLILFLLLTGRLFNLPPISFNSALYLTLSGIIGLVIGASVYIKSLSFLDLSVAYPVSHSTWIISAVLFAVLFLGETINIKTILGGVLVLLGLIFLTHPEKKDQKKLINNNKGLPFALLAGFCWAFAGVFLKLGIKEVDPLLVNFVRLPATVLILTLLTIKEKPSLNIENKKALAHVGISGFFDQFVAAFLFFTAIKLIGVAKTTILSAVSPLFVAPLSIIILKERISLKIGIGTILCVLGAWLTYLK